MAEPLTDNARRERDELWIEVNQARTRIITLRADAESARRECERLRGAIGDWIAADRDCEELMDLNVDYAAEQFNQRIQALHAAQEGLYRVRGQEPRHNRRIGRRFGGRTQGEGGPHRWLS